MLLRLTRTDQTSAGTFGKLDFDRFSLFTLEDDWLENEPGKSCIPAGEYTLRRTIFQRHNLPTWEVTNVPNRSRILIHPGNTEEDTEGCILLGVRRGSITVERDEDTGEVLKMKEGVLASKEAFRRFMLTVKDESELTLVITWVDGLPKEIIV